MAALKQQATSEAVGRALERPVNILLVDDLPEKHVALRAVLEELEQNIVSVYSGSEALRAILEQDFAVILLDVNMPDIDGFETARLIRGYPRTARTPILFISAYVDEQLAIKGYALGAVDYIASPVVPQILRSKVKVFVELHLLNQQLREQALAREALIRAEAAQATAEGASRRAIFLEQVSQSLTKSIEIDCIMQVLLENTIPGLSQWGAVSLKYENTYIDRLAQADPQALEGVRMQAYVPCAGLRREIGGVLQTRGQKTLLREARREEDAFEGLGDDVSCLLLFSLVSGRRALGALILAFDRAQEPSESTVTMAIELASRASFALENAYLYKAIQDADQRKNEFLAMLAHELRNPLAPIRNAASVIAGIEAIGGRAKWAAEVIEHQVQHMTHIVDDLLDLSRVASGKIGITRNLLELQTVVARAIETSEPLIKAKAQRLVMQQPEAPVMLEGDVLRLSQVLSNLLNNASKFTHEGGTITLAVTSVSDEVSISVKDNGRGIAEEFLAHVFDLFAQATPSLDRAEGGLGIGLTLVKHLVEMHHGTVQVQSAGLGQGAEFVVRLPAAPGTAATPLLGASPAPTRPTNRTRVLVVDDLALAAETLALLLEMNGHEVSMAFDGAEALARFDSFRPGVVVLDIGLPDLNGFEIARMMRERARARRPLLIALSGYGNEIDKRRAVEAGFDHYFVKPASIDKLLLVISGAEPA
ncbi:MAG TPA: response regulator [Burkholderiaceae bacterium]|nr:response regulator [Burkholderiaceae bacterium]